MRGKTVYLQYSNRQEIVNSKNSGDVASNVLLVTIEGVEAGDVSIDVLHLVSLDFVVTRSTRGMKQTQIVACHTILLGSGSLLDNLEAVQNLRSHLGPQKWYRVSNLLTLKSQDQGFDVVRFA